MPFILYGFQVALELATLKDTFAALEGEYRHLSTVNQHVTEAQRTLELAFREVTARCNASEHRNEELETKVLHLQSIIDEVCAIVHVLHLFQLVVATFDSVFAVETRC